MKYVTLLFGLLFCYLPIQAHDDVLEELKQVVKASDKYDSAKKEQIKTIHQKAIKAKSLDNRYKAYIQLSTSNEV